MSAPAAFTIFGGFLLAVVAVVLGIIGYRRAKSGEATNGGMAIGGIVLKCVFPGRYDRLAILLYLGMGWSGVLVAPPLSGILPPVTLCLIVIGGIIYSVGVIFHVWEKLRFQNAIWHGFVVTAAAVHYSAVMTAIAA